VGLDDAEQMLRQFENQIEEQLAQASRLKEEMELVRVTAHSRAGDVEATVDSTGGLVDLHFTEAAMRRSPQELAAEVLAVTRTAQSKLAARMSEVMAGILGPGSETAQFVTNTYAERFPAPSGPDGEHGGYR